MTPHVRLVWCGLLDRTIAVGLAMLPPEEPVRRSPRRSGRAGTLRRVLGRVFDASDALADRIRRTIRSG